VVGLITIAVLLYFIELAPCPGNLLPWRFLADDRSFGRISHYISLYTVRNQRIDLEHFETGREISFGQSFLSDPWLDRSAILALVGQRGAYILNEAEGIARRQIWAKPDRQFLHWTVELDYGSDG
jgi:hypothetical protein